jgi:arylformamidase
VGPRPSPGDTPGTVSDIDYEAEYNNSRRVPEADDLADTWRTRSEEYRSVARAELDQAYAAGERNRYDMFLGDGDDESAAAVLYIHGGYWQQGDRKVYSFLAEAFNCSGLNVVIPSYTLSPAASVREIVDQLRVCLAAVWKKTGVRPLVVGHSAGGHLTAAMLATDWSEIRDVPDDLVRAGIAISGIFDLRPLVTTSINAVVGLDLDGALAASPRWWRPPPSNRTLIAAVGGDESAEFRRQSREMAEHWRAAGVRSEYLEVQGANHFTVVEQLASPGTALFKRALELAQNSAGTGARSG